MTDEIQLDDDEPAAPASPEVDEGVANDEVEVEEIVVDPEEES